MTKYISYRAVLDSVVVYDKGSLVSTRNLLYGCADRAGCRDADEQ